MPIVEIPQFKIDRRTYYRSLTLIMVGIAVGVPVVMLVFPVLLFFLSDSMILGDAISGTLAYLMFIGWYPIWQAVKVHRHYLHFSQAFDFAVHDLEFAPALFNQPATKIAVSFQWPKDFETGYPSGEEKHKIIPVSNPIEAVRSATAAALNQFFDQLSREQLPSIPLHFVYQEVTYQKIEQVIFPWVQAVAEHSHFPFIRFDCTSLQLPKPPKPQKPTPTDRVYL